MEKQRSVLIVGAGIIGLATAYKLLLRRPDLHVRIIEKEADVAAHQSSHNSGVIHAGLYYRPDSNKAKLCTNGRRELVDFCSAHGVRFEITGKLVVATDEREIPALKSLYERGVANGLAGIAMLTREQVYEREPNVSCVAGLLVPQSGIVSFAEVARVLLHLIRELGGEVSFGASVTRFSRNTKWRVATTNQEYEADFLISCAGLQADRVARMAGANTTIRIVPFRGKYFTVASKRASLVRGLVYPVPNPKFPFLGVHMTRDLNARLHIGPTASLALSREGYGRFALSPKDVLNATTFPGLWRFAARNWPVVLEGVRLGASKRAFLRAAQRLVPAVAEADLAQTEYGIRAQAMRSNGELEDDFVFVDGPASVHVLNAPSPAATACLAIGATIADRVSNDLAATTKLASYTST